MTGCGFCMSQVLTGELRWCELTPVVKDLPLGIMLRGSTLQPHAMPLCHLCVKAIKEGDWEEIVERGLIMFFFTVVILGPPENQYITYEVVEHVKARVQRFKEMNIEVHS